MSQPRMRKTVTNGDEGPRGHGSVSKASGDSVACSGRANQQTRSRSKNKIPKSVRYDLENALVSLCDVWFEEIKPHLVRNNIKLHVHGGSAGGDHERAGTPRCVPPALATTTPSTSGCSHLDPGAAPDHPRRRDVSFAGCCSTLPTASRAPCVKLRTLSRRPLSPLPSLPPTPRSLTQTQSHNCDEKQVKRPRIRRKKRRTQPQPRSSWRVPRLCRTYSVLCAAGTSSRVRAIAPHLPPPCEKYYRFIAPRRNSMMKSKSTQTEEAEVSRRSLVSMGCQWEEPELLQGSSMIRRNLACSPGYRSLASCSPGSRSPMNPALCSPKSPSSCSPKSHTLKNLKSFAPRSPSLRSPSPNNPSSSPCRGFSELSLPKPRVTLLRHQGPTVTEELPLFQDDLIDIIGVTNDKRLRLLYSSPEKEAYPSFMNLVPQPSTRQKKPGGLKIQPPWR